MCLKQYNIKKPYYSKFFYVLLIISMIKITEM